MTLRTRLALVVVVTALPLVAGLAWVQHQFQVRSAREAVVQFLRLRMDNGGRERCEAEPETFPGPRSEDSLDPRHDGPGGRGPGRGRPGPPPRDGGPPPGPPRRPRAPREVRVDHFAYDAAFESRNPAAFPFPAGLRASLEAGEEFAAEPWEEDGTEGLVVAVRMNWDDGPCVYVVGRRPWPEESRGLRELLRASILLCCGLLAAVVLAAGPVVARIRTLTEQVLRSAGDSYDSGVDVTGSDEVTELAQAFNDAGTEIRSRVEIIEQREQALRSFVANTTHDVMIPLTVLQGHLADLRERVDAGETPDRRRLEEAADEAAYLGSLVQNLEAAAKLESGEAEMQHLPVSLAALVERAAGRHRPVARQRDIALEHAVPEEPVVVSGDETLVEQAVSNLVHNAVRHNRAGGHVAVVLESTAEGFRLRVSDDGPGIEARDLARLTDRAWRGDDARTRTPDGRGLGLHIARTVCERHGFTLRFQRLEPSGLEAVIEGPVAP